MDMGVGGAIAFGVTEEALLIDDFVVSDAEVVEAGAHPGDNEEEDKEESKPKEDVGLKE